MHILIALLLCAFFYLQADTKMMSTLLPQSEHIEQNISLLEHKKADFVLTNSDIAHKAYQKDDKLRAVVALYPKVLTFITYKDSNITSFEDIQKVLSKVTICDQSGSTQSLLSSLGVEQNLTQLDFSTTQKELKERKIKGFFTLLAHPDPKLERLHKEQNITVVPLYGKKFDQLKMRHSFILKGGIPEGLYQGIDHDIKSICIKEVLLTRADVNESRVYTLTKSLLENIQTIKKTHPIFRGISKKHLLEHLSIPQHEGAIKAFNDL